MKYIGGNLYLADEGKVIVRKADDFVMGNGIDLGINDTISNYKERKATDEEMELYYPVDAYKAASGWSDYASIIEAIPTE